MFAFPVLGAPLAVLALEHGNGDLVSDLAQAPTAPPDAAAADFGRLAVALPSCEALMAGTVEERRAIIATLVRRGDADAVALLRWALGASDPDLAVDAALALEEMTASFDAQPGGLPRGARRRAGQGAETAGDAAPALPAARPRSRPPSSSPTRSTSASPIPRWCRRSRREARDDFELAADGQPRRRTRSRSGARSSSSARCAPTPRSPASTRRCPAAGPEIRPVLLSLREEALLASHALPWEGPSALASTTCARNRTRAGRRR